MLRNLLVSLAVLVCASALPAPAAPPAPPAPPGPAGPSIEIVKASDPKRPHLFQLRGSAGELLCRSEAFKSRGKAAKAAEAAKAPGASLKHYIFQKDTGPQGRERHWWELKDAKGHKVLCTSEKVENEAEVERSAGAATKAFAQAQVKR